MIPRATTVHAMSAGFAHAPSAPRPGFLIAAENAVLSLTFALLAGLPLAEMPLRAAARGGFQGSSALVQHLTMAIGMLGAAAAARLLGCSAAAAVSALLCYASFQLVDNERAASRILLMVSRCGHR
ncbi:MAG: hypothetical protein HYY78_17480 [Betaproteobacteria bacterium]|nr:hypothetical protein [Betaproteobacteria bacterium]